MTSSSSYLPDFRRFIRTGLFTCLLAAFLLPLWTSPAHGQLQKDDLTFRAVGTAAFPLGPDALSDGYAAGRGLNTGIGVYLTSSFDLQTTLEYTKYSLQSPETLSGNLLRPDQQPPANITGGGDLTRLTMGAGLKYQISSGSTLRPYLRGTGHISSLTRRHYRTETESRPRSPRVDEENQLATGFSVGLGFEFPIGYTAAFILEPSYTTHYADSQTLQGFDIRFGLVLGEF